MKRGHFAPQICPTQPSVCPPKLELKLPTGFLDLLGSRQRCFKGPRFQHLLRNKVPRCDSGIHLAGTGEGAAICCPIPPLPHLSPGKEGVEEVGQGVEETQPSLLIRRWFGEGLLLPG